MGQIADDIISGFQCSHCGTCFEKAHGHPVLCKECWKEATIEERKSIARATEKEL